MGNKRVERAHRIAYFIAHGSIPEGALVLHRCDNRLCVNPSHLYAGTQAENVADAVARRRAGKYGHLVDAARDLRASGLTVREIAQRLGIGRTAAADMVSHRTWR